MTNGITRTHNVCKCLLVFGTTQPHCFRVRARICDVLSFPWLCLNVYCTNWRVVRVALALISMTTIIFGHDGHPEGATGEKYLIMLDKDVCVTFHYWNLYWGLNFRWGRNMLTINNWPLTHKNVFISSIWVISVFLIILVAKHQQKE